MLVCVVDYGSEVSVCVGHSGYRCRIVFIPIRDLSQDAVLLGCYAL